MQSDVIQFREGLSHESSVYVGQPLEVVPMMQTLLLDKVRLEVSLESF